MRKCARQCGQYPSASCSLRKKIGDCTRSAANALGRKITTLLVTGCPMRRRRARNLPDCQSVRINDDLNFRIGARCSNRALKTNKSLWSASIAQSLACTFRAFSVPSAMALMIVFLQQPICRANCRTDSISGHPVQDLVAKL